MQFVLADYWRGIRSRNTRSHYEALSLYLFQTLTQLAKVTRLLFVPSRCSLALSSLNVQRLFT
jgi:hypothetical protein